MQRRAIKQQVLSLLQGDDLAAILESLRVLPLKDCINALFAAICREEAHVRWLAILCMGDAVARLAAEDMEAARMIMRRLLWSLNDESGGIGWGAPEAIAAILARHAGLAKDYIHMLISYTREDGPEAYQDGNYLEHPLLQRGLLWGLAHVSACRPELLRARGAEADLMPYLDAEDPETRGLAATALGALGYAAATAPLRLLCDDPAEFVLYQDGGFIQTSVAALAQSALATLEHLHA